MCTPWKGEWRGGPEETNEASKEGEEDLDTPMADSSDDDSVANIFAVAKPVAVRSDEEHTADLEAKADEVFEEWMTIDPNFKEYLFNGVEPLEFGEGGKVTFLELMQKFDTIKYFQESGTEEYPTISMLARIHFSRMDNSAFQERVFSTAASAQSDRQSSMTFDHLEERTLLQANRDSLRAGIIQ